MKRSTMRGKNVNDQNSAVEELDEFVAPVIGPPEGGGVGGGGLLGRILRWFILY